MTKYITYNNERYGSWTIVEAKSNRSLVRCVCGVERLVRNADLISGASKSCGKKVCGTDFSNLEGMKFGFLQVLKITDSRLYSGSIVWECQCVCGKILTVPSKRLISGTTKSCGCKRDILRVSQKTLLSDFERVARKIFNSYKRGAQSRNIKFYLSREEFDSLIQSNCYYCGTPPNKSVFIKRLLDNIEIKYNGIDRLNSNLDYTIDNCVSACWVCNRAKSDDSLEDFLKWLDNLLKFRSVNNVI